MKRVNGQERRGERDENEEGKWVGRRRERDRNEESKWTGTKRVKRRD